MKQLDLFAGIGGISLAAEWAGIETVAFCEKEPFAQGVLRRRFPGRPIYEDVFQLTREVLENDGITDIDIIAGGFPCQPFSHAGKRQGTGDDRYLWPEMCRIIGEVRPTWVLAENVDGLVSMAQSDWEFVMEEETTICEEAEMVLETIRKDLENIGYRAISIIIPACGVGASHRRYRIFILGYTECSGRSGESRRWSGEEFADGYCELEKGDLANSYSIGDNCQRKYSTDGDGQARNQRGQESQHRLGNECKVVPDSSSAGCQERYASTLSSESGYYPGCSHEGRTNRATQPGMGGSPYELSDWVDGIGMNLLDALINFISSYPQPALMGQEQHAWEPPRVAIGVKNRAARLKALGNAVDPLQALPILYGIRVINESF
ncbi:DNA (cytosine-5-)-methyltransferase [Brevibacillus sp. MER 51]|uniref:DNA cytosine methyltransferase n=1 Tax=Brevibacillus sp. MER 51 TaxID=2939560 RepID=UPI0020406226|nr:DNA (cytosine-5-)-methyltransferase [Brevibacillus sp. MER 51]